MTAKYEIRVLFKSNEAPWSGGYDPSPYGPKNDGEAVEWAVRMQEGLGDLYAVTLTRDGQVMALPEPPTPAGGPQIDCPKCGEGDERAVGMNKCGLCECEFFVASNGSAYSPRKRPRPLSAEAIRNDTP